MIRIVSVIALAAASVMPAWATDAPAALTSSLAAAKDVADAAKDAARSAIKNAARANPIATYAENPVDINVGGQSAPVASSKGNLARAPSAFPKRFPSQDVGIAEGTNLTNALFDYATKTSSYCGNVVAGLKRQATELKAKQTRTNAWGAVVALIGGVAAYAPAKAILMAVGISSGNDSNSVLGAVSNSFGTQASVTQKEIDELQKRYQGDIDSFNLKTNNNDPDGAGRFADLILAQSACDGMFPIANSALSVVDDAVVQKANASLQHQ